MAYTDSISPKQEALIKRLMGTLPGKLDASEGSVEAAQVTDAVAGVQDVLVKVMSGQPVMVGEARPVIDVLIQADKLLTRASAKTLTPGIVNADRIIPNKFAKDCEYCKATVEAGEGHAALIVGGWKTFCAQCASETPEVRSERIQAMALSNPPQAAPTAAQSLPEVGVYVADNGDLIKVYRGQSGQLLTKTNSGRGWAYSGHASKQAARCTRKITAAEAAVYGHNNDECVFCQRALEDVRSTEVGYGPVCAQHNDLPWGAPKAALPIKQEV